MGNVDGPRLVLAIDFNTESTGGLAAKTSFYLGVAYLLTGAALAWCLVRPRHNLDLENVHIHRTWPAGESERVRSAISYTKSPIGKLQWGHDIESDSWVCTFTELDLPTDPGAHQWSLQRTIRWMGLMQEYLANQPDRPSTAILENSCLDTETVLTDFLKRLIGHWLECMASDAAGLICNVPMNVAVVCPCVSVGLHLEESMR